MAARWGRAAALVAGLLAWSVRPALAHGITSGAMQLLDQPVGQYFLSVWTGSVPAAVGVLHVTIALHGGAAGGVVVGAVIEVTVRNASGAVLATAVAREGDTNKFLYEADVQLMAPGDMEVEVAVKDPQAAGAARFALLVRAGTAPVPAPGAVWLAALAALVVLMLGGALAALR
ncbi:MAG: hypothetical protein RL635_683, partial [Chloroflexota bacterium]